MRTYWAAAALWTIVGAVPAAAAGYALKPASASAQFEQPAPTAIAERAFPGTRINYVGGGTFHVPGEAPPGRYMITPSGSTIGCIWKRLKANDDKPKSVIAAGAPNRGASDEIIVEPSDRFLALLGDCTLVRLP